ncbi:MAG: thioredoxin domain-containing protein [Planctomycetota bacterium]
MEALIRERGTVRLRKIDVVSWDSAVSQQFGIRRLPTLRLYDGTRLVSDDSRHVLRTLTSQ